MYNYWLCIIYEDLYFCDKNAESIVEMLHNDKNLLSAVYDKDKNTKLNEERLLTY